MPQAPLESVVAHWHKLFNGFNTSSDDFYARVVLTLREREVPGFKTSRVTWKEGGVLSPNREYLRISGDRYVSDMCAAPFGTGFFFSSWVTKKQPRFVLFYLAAIALAMFAAYRALFGVVRNVLSGMNPYSPRSIPPHVRHLLLPLLDSGGWVVWTILVLLPFCAVVCLVALAARGGFKGPEEAIRKVPLIGWLYTRVFVPETYYRIDTLQIFHSAVHTAMVETIDSVVTQKGLRGLTEDERKPVFTQLLKR